MKVIYYFAWFIVWATVNGFLSSVGKAIGGFLGGLIMATSIGIGFAGFWLIFNAFKIPPVPVATVEGREAFKRNVPQSSNPYLKPNAEIESLELAELWFVGYLAAERESR